jgi:hypothetical protein
VFEDRLVRSLSRSLVSVFARTHTRPTRGDASLVLFSAGCGASRWEQIVDQQKDGIASLSCTIAITTGVGERSADSFSKEDASLEVERFLAQSF